MDYKRSHAEVEPPRASEWPTGARLAPGSASPLRVLVVMLALVITVETAIMLALAQWTPEIHASLLLSLVDATLLALLLAPALWLVVVRPLQGLVEQRGVLLARIFEVQETERARIARDLHDELGQQLTAVLLALRAAADATDAGPRRAALETARRLASESLESVRRLARGLALVVLHDLGLRAALERLCEDTAQAAGLEVVRDLAAVEDPLTPRIEIAVYRVVQEALTNVARHAQARRVAVRLARDGTALELSVADDGKGPGLGDQAGRGGLGLQGMRERIGLLGGVLRVESAPGSGTLVTARIPKAFPG